MLLLATVIDYLVDDSGALGALLTLVLILVTTGYVVLNWRMVGEMRQARRQALLPKLPIDLHAIAPTILVPRIRNVGPGAAFEVDVALIFEPIEGERVVERVWRANVIAPGKQPSSSPNSREAPPPTRALRGDAAPRLDEGRVRRAVSRRGSV